MYTAQIDKITRPCRVHPQLNIEGYSGMMANLSLKFEMII